MGIVIADVFWREHAGAGLAVALLAAAGMAVVVLWWWFIGPRRAIARRRRGGRCPVCNYHIAGDLAVVGVCPRCGADLRSPPG